MGHDVPDSVFAVMVTSKAADFFAPIIRRELRTSIVTDFPGGILSMTASSVRLNAAPLGN
ncbi:MAG: hypothetical protein M5T61_17250 [Acidimicrobiia bacterium]|nr:hypothetical protein [Acidimicrobiia bacterium]